jgi:hypothetical protein
MLAAEVLTVTFSEKFTVNTKLAVDFPMLGVGPLTEEIVG